MALLHERARRLRLTPDLPPLLRALSRGESSQDVARRHGLPLAHVRGVRTFYDALHDFERNHCAGTACWLAEGAPPTPGHGVHCRGRCYAPHDIAAVEIPRAALSEAVVLRHLVEPRGLDPFGDYALPDGATILEAVERSALRGRGGAAYPTGAKWRAAREASARERVVIANGDEGDPGAFIDRLLMEEAPHSLLAGMLACARAIGARTGYVFVRGEYAHAAHALERAVVEARERGLLGAELDVSVIQGAGAYVAGEETALLRAIEGGRAEPQPKPPYPAQAGLWGLPTVVQNVETLSLIPWVVTHARKPSTKAFCLSGAVRWPGVVEARLGTTLAQLLQEGGGGKPLGCTWKMALVGGPMGRVIPASRFDVALDYETLPGLGHGGIVVMDDSVSAGALFQHLAAFAASESCGSCTPCRAGTSQLAHIRDAASLEALLDVLEAGSLCGFGQGVPRPIRDLLTHYPDELFADSTRRSAP